jgi:hypothetical protein
MAYIRHGVQKVSDLVGEISRPLFQSHGLLDERLVFYWAEIVGEKLANYSFPLKLVGGGALLSKTPRLLEILVTPGAALELTYAKNVIIAKINQFFGYALITDIRLKHGNIQKADKFVRKKNKKPLNDQENEHIEAIVHPISDDHLRNALKNLGKALLSHIKEGK